MPRVYLRSLCAEQEDQQQDQGKLVPLDVQLLSGHVRDSQRTLMNFFQRLLDMRKELSSERRALHPEMLANWQEQLQQIQKIANHDVDEFFRSVEEFLQHSADSDSLPYETFAHSKGRSINFTFIYLILMSLSLSFQVLPICTNRNAMLTASPCGRRYA